ncbi:MAG: PIN domain-containing protein [Gemmatimonadota bacterium]|nr:PIN domain-containing protein [Gemmatimonadota bacterium]
MIALDTNILVYAHRADSEWHTRASAAVADLANGSGSWAIPWPCIHEFFSVVTHPRIFSPPTPRERACAQVDAWLESPSLVMIGEDAGYWETLRASIMSGKIAGPAVHDARISAICSRHGVNELWSADRDFSRITAVRVRNPLAT